MIIFKEDKESKLSCGINDDGDLFFCDKESGKNLSDTPENREWILKAFDRELAEFQRYRLSRSSIKVDEGIIEKLDSLVDNLVLNYKSDWTQILRPRISSFDKNDSFLVVLRQDGVSAVVLKGFDTDYVNLLSGKACLDSEKAEKYMFYDNGKLKSVSHSEALSMVKKAIKELPSDYVDACEAASYKMRKCPKLEVWKEESGYNMKQKKQAAKGFVR